MKHWLLNLAVNQPIRLLQFLPTVKSESLNACPIPGCGAEDYASGLLSLLDSSMVQLFTYSPDDERINQEAKLPYSELLDRYVQLPEAEPPLLAKNRGRLTLQRTPIWDDPGFQHAFRLTPAGGDAWASVAEPAWERFCSESSDYDNAEMTSSNRDLLMARMGWFTEVTSDLAVKVDTIKFETGSNYPILYWKTLPVVYRVTFEVERAKPRWIGGDVAEPAWFREWRFQHWYKHPWELPNWPSK